MVEHSPKILASEEKKMPPPPPVEKKTLKFVNVVSDSLRGMCVFSSELQPSMICLP